MRVEYVPEKTPVCGHTRTGEAETKLMGKKNKLTATATATVAREAFSAIPGHRHVAPELRLVSVLLHPLLERAALPRLTQVSVWGKKTDCGGRTGQ